MQKTFDLDFKELGKNEKQGYGFQALVREIGLKLGYGVRPGGTGPDGGKDQIFTVIDHTLYDKQVHRRWLVSCKDFSKSGDSVGRDDLNNALNDTFANKCRGFLLASTMNVSEPARRLLEELENSATPIDTHVWDGSAIKRILHENEDLFLLTLIRFFPKSYASTMPLVGRLLENFIEIVESESDAEFHDLQELVWRVQDLSSSTTNQQIKFRLGEALLFRLAAADEEDIALLYPLIPEWITKDGKIYEPFAHALQYYLREHHASAIQDKIHRASGKRANLDTLHIEKIETAGSKFVITLRVEFEDRSIGKKVLTLVISERDFQFEPA